MTRSSSHKPGAAPSDASADPQGGRLRWRVAVVAWAVAIIAAIAAAIGLLDRLTTPTAAGDAFLKYGASVAVGLGICVAILRPTGLQARRRLGLVAFGVWPFATFLLFIAWRIGISAEQLHACDGGDHIACHELAVRKARRGRVEIADRLHRRACAGQEPRSCTALGLRAVDDGAPDAAALLAVGCDGGIAHACVGLGRLQRDAGRDDNARRWMARACELGDASACAEGNLIEGSR